MLNTIFTLLDAAATIVIVSKISMVTNQIHETGKKF